MTLYRGPGGTGSATSDADTTLYQELLTQTQVARDAALQAETNAELAEANAETAQSAAQTSATSAASSASAASTSATNAASSASSASSSASAASTSATNAASSATAAASSASSASSSASAASTSATNAASSATAAASSASSASTSATNAANSATSASNSASTATTQATNAASSATAAASSATSAATSATNAANSASAAATSATNAANSASAAAASAASIDPATIVRTTGDQTIGGNKTFSSTISGSINGNAATVTNGVYTTGDQTIGGNKTFSNTISGSINGNAATVTNGVYTTGDQTIAGTKTFSSNPILNAGTANQVQFLNGSKALTGSANLTFNGTTLTAADITDSSLTVNRVVYAGTGGNLVNSANLTFDGTNLGVGTSSVLGNSTVNVLTGLAVWNNGATVGYHQTYNSNAGINLKTWRWGGDSSGNWLLQTVNDAYNSATTRLSVDPNGAVAMPAASVAGNNISAVNSLGFRNRIINGDMRIDQRNNGASVVVANNNAFVVDRFRYLNSAGSVTCQQSTVAPAGFTNSIQLTVGTSNTPGAADFQTLRHVIEGFNTADFAWGTASATAVTMSFWVRSSVTGTYSVGFRNSAVNRAYVATYSVASANTWEYKTITVPGDTSGTWVTNNGVGVYIDFSLGTGSNNETSAGSWQSSSAFAATGEVNWISTNGATFNITGVQLEAGSVATPFERRDYGRELMMCQRYYCQGGNGAPGIFNGGSTARYSVILPVAMRATPTTTAIAAPVVINPTVAEQQTGSQTTGFSVTGFGASVNYSVAQIQFGGFSSGADGRPTTLLNTALQFSAEL